MSHQKIFLELNLHISDLRHKRLHLQKIYAWVFPHGNHCSIGVGSEKKDFSAPDAVRQLRRDVKLDGAETVRCEGAPIP